MMTIVGEGRQPSRSMSNLSVRWRSRDRISCCPTRRPTQYACQMSRLHVPDLEAPGAEQDRFHTRAREIMGIAPQ
jgi:hypothetical protein